MASVIVFGPTGNVGSWAARAAHQHGAKVWLAMRDTSKTIPGLSVEEEKSGKYERVQADLLKPETISAALKTSGATRAFIYVMHRSQDRMKSTLDALKAGGIEFVVCLSSFTINKEPREIEPIDLIPYVHAQAEISLEEVFGKGNFVPVRAGVFATNILRSMHGMKDGVAWTISKSWPTDCITPNDIGEVSGTILVQGPRDGQHAVYLYGPERMPMETAIERVANVFGKKIQVMEWAPEQYRAINERQGMPQRMTEYMLRATKLQSEETAKQTIRKEEGSGNVQRYLGRPGTKLEDWVSANRELFEF